MLFDLAGRRVRRFELGRLKPGSHAVNWDARDDGGQPVPAGVYLLRLEVDGQPLDRRKMIVLD